MNFSDTVQRVLLVFIIWIAICSNALNLADEQWASNEIMIKKHTGTKAKKQKQQSHNNPHNF